MYTKLSAVTLALLMVVPVLSHADEPIHRGEQSLAQYTEAAKTADGKKEKRLVKVTYDWDTGTIHTRSYNSDGDKVNSHSIQRPPTPDEAEISQAIKIVQQHPEVRSITARQAGIDINGGFPHTELSGVCARPARCVQMFLFDAENVVRHMLVDLRIGKVVDSNYIPPQNRGAE